MIRLALLFSLLSTPAFAGTFYALDATFVDEISADGSVVLAHGDPDWKSQTGAILWTRERTRQLGFSQGNDLSADGSTVAGPTGAWTIDGWKFASSSPLVGVSGDGSKAVSRDGVLFDASGQAELGFFPFDISADGQWVVGTKDWRPYLWNGHGAFLSDQPVVPTLDGFVSGDGSIVYFSSPSTFRWQEATGAVDVPYFGRVLGVSDNGLYAVGQGHYIDDQGETQLFTPEGIVWSGAYADGWLLFATAVSDDGLVLAGHGYRFSTKQYQAWVYDRGATWLPGDANRDGHVDLADFGTLKTNFGSGRSWSYGDFDGSGRIDLSDFGILKSQFGVAAPEPAALSLVAAALLLFIVAGRRRTLRMNATGRG